MRGDSAQEHLAEILQLGGADAVHLGEPVQVVRPQRRHVDQGAIRKDHIGRHLALPRQPQPHRLERRQQIRIAAIAQRRRISARLAARRCGAEVKQAGAAAQILAPFGDRKAAMIVGTQESRRHHLAD